MNTRARTLLVSSTIIISACHGDSVTRAPDATTSERAALSASTTLPVALSGRIVEPATTLAAAATRGAITVGDDGMTNYSVPIWVPDGVNGMQPSLSVDYDSGGRIGTLGPKWSLKGLSVIMRCAQTLSQDGVQRPVSFTGDTFCLDGQRLRRQTGSANQVGDFRTELNPFQKISATATDAGGVSTFQVNQPDGRIFYYGRTAASRVVFTMGPDTQTYAYYLDKIQDRFGNSILISYTSHASQLNPPLTSGTATQALFPSSIQWGGTNDTAGLRKVTFEYQPPTYYPFDHQRRVAGNMLVGGEHLTSISVFGPDGNNGQMLLKVYKFTYSRPSITVEQLLTTLQECDGSGFCKRPTTMTWEPGSMDYTRTDLTATQGITDIPMSNAPMVGSHSMSNVYRRLMGIDLNRDGRDDLVYRVWTNTCTSWVARLATASGTFSAPIALPGATEADRGCPGGDAAGTTTYWPNTSDILFSDLDQNGYPDVIGAAAYNGGRAGNVSAPVNPQLSGYNVYLNNSGSPLTYSTTKLAVDSADTDKAYALVGIGDVNGDGYPDIVRPNLHPESWFGAFWFSTRFPNTSQNMIGTQFGGPLVDFAAVDADGDGTVEIFRLGAGGQEVVTSPTMNTSANNGPQTNLLPMTGHSVDPSAPYNMTTQRWQADLNGDGLMDYASVASSFTPTQIYTAIATGGVSQFVQPYSGGVITVPQNQFEIGSGWQIGLDDGVRVADFNLDGRDDLILMGNGASASVVRPNVVVLLSNGDGNFSPWTTTVPVGDPADGIREVYSGTMPFPVVGEHGYRTSATLDFNGDGLPDLVQLEGGHVIAYTRKGKMPDMVTGIVEGTGHSWNITYAPLSDPSTYTTDTSCAFSNPSLGCLVKGRWLTKQVADTALERPNALLTTNLSYTYNDGQYDLNGGRGFLGFVRRDKFGPGSQHTVVTTNPGFKTVGAGYIYPTAFLPATVRTDTETPQGPNGHHYTTELTSYGSITTSGVGNTLVTVFPTSITDTSYDCAPNGVGDCSGAPRVLGKSITKPIFDVYGNLTNREVDHINGAGATTQTDTDVMTFNPADTTNWLVRQLAKKVSTSATSTETVTRFNKYVTSPTTGVLNSIEIEPNGDSPTHLFRSFGHDTRGRVTSVTDGAFPSAASCNTSCTNTCVPSCNASCGTNGTCLQGCMASCTGGCNATCETTPNQTRATGYLYEDADGVYVTTTTNSLSQPKRQWRHPGWGYLVEEDDPNNLAEVWTYDTFGRIVSHTQRTGGKEAYTYNDAEDPGSSDAGGVDYSIVPNGTATAAVQIHLDSLGREVFRTVPVDSARVVTTWKDYDNFGRLRSTLIETGSPSNPLATNQNSDTTTYDDMSRPISECHLDSTGTNQCKTVTYDGLQTTATDESGHVIVRTTDSQSRPATEASGGTQLAAFGYGPFGLLESETVSQTTIAYDVLGRQVSLNRPLPGIRKTVYNAYGEIVTSNKLRSDGTQIESVTIERDALGRMKTLSGSSIPSRTFYYDQSPLGSGGTNTVGKLIDALDGTNQIHFDYGANGLLTDENWKLGLFGAAAKSFGSITYGYDAFGRTSSVTYPQNLPRGNYTAFNVGYGYDPYVQDVSSLTSNGATLWSAAARNALGEVTQESLKSAGGTTLSAAATYFMPTGQLQTRSLNGPTTQVSEAYSYKKNSLPSTFQVTAPSGSYAETYGYDNLNRITGWTANNAGPSLAYSYDANGLLALRTWSGETVTYTTQTVPNGSTTAPARVTTVVQNGVTVETDKYLQDSLGRVFQGPTSSLVYNGLDELIAATDLSNGNSGVTFDRDALGERVATTYTPGNSYLITLMNDMYELKFNGATNAYEERCRFRANGRVIGDQVRTVNTGPSKTTFYLVNNLGSVIAEASDAGVLVARGQRDPYGNAIANSMIPNLPPEPLGANPDGTSRLGFADHERETGIGLVDMLARFYSPRLGQFVAPDTIITRTYEARSYYAYAYAWDNPVAFFDPSGHDLSPSSGYDGGSFGGAGWQGGQGGGADMAGYAAAEAADEGARAAGGTFMSSGGYAPEGDAGGAIPGEDGFWGDVGFPCGASVPFVPASRPAGHRGGHGASTSQLMASGKGGSSTQSSTDSTGGTQAQGSTTPPGDAGSADDPASGSVCEWPTPSSPGKEGWKTVGGAGVRVYAGSGPLAGSVGVFGVGDGDNIGIAISIGASGGAAIPTGAESGVAIEGMLCNAQGGVPGLNGASTGGSLDTPFGSFGSSSSSTSDCDFGGPGLGLGLGVSAGAGSTVVVPLPAGFAQPPVGMGGWEPSP